MRIGALLPANELRGDTLAIRDWVQAVEGLGYHHILVFDHVLGFWQSPNPSYLGPATPDVYVHEALTLLAYLAALTSRVELVTGVLVLPMRQTVIVAKQAAEIDALSGGRLRLGVGVGHVEREFPAVNEDWRTRGRRIEEQIALLRSLWTDDNLHFDGRWHRLVDGAGLMRPGSVQQPIPIWLGGNSEAAIARAARIADGAMPVLLRPNTEAQALVAQFRAFVEAAGRGSDEVGLNTFFALRAVRREEWASDATGWRELGVTHLTVEAEQAGLESPQAHIDTLRRLQEVVFRA